MYKAYVYTLINGNIQGLAHRKQQKLRKAILPPLTLTVCQCAAE